jgi:predicted dinucleotide-binding enzyme
MFFRGLLYLYMTDDTITSVITVQNPHLQRDVTMKVLRCHSVSVCGDKTQTVREITHQLIYICLQDVELGSISVSWNIFLMAVFEYFNMLS